MAKVIVIGGGAAGLMAAGCAARRGAQVLVLERNDRPARKVMITGKGRCNVTNNCNLVSDLVANVPTNGRFLFSAFMHFMPNDLMELVENEGVPLKIERGNRVFPVSDHASDVSKAFLNALRGQALKLQAEVLEILTENGRVSGVRVRDALGERALPCVKK